MDSVEETQKLGCLTISQFHDSCGGRLNCKTVIIVGLRCKVTVRCQLCYEHLSFEGKHKGYPSPSSSGTRLWRSFGRVADGFTHSLGLS